MAEKTNNIGRKKYFAAANGYTGFRSLWSETFKSEDFDRIFVLKGGPGTGKSTLMKQLLNHSEERGLRCEVIFCSSDPSSLDGLIIGSGGIKIAVLDGTSPHERDAIIPGATDEIINLADGFDIEGLQAERERIIELCKSKGSAYKKAYSILRSAGSVWNTAFDIFRNSEAYYKAERTAAELRRDEKGSCGMLLGRKLISSFSRLGHTFLPVDSSPDLEVISISGDGISEYIVMGLIRDRLLSQGGIRELYLSPFSDGICDGLLTPTRQYIISNDNASRNVSLIEEDSCREINSLMTLHRELLSLSSIAFKEASEYHFALEDIYSRHVDFSKNQRFLNRIENYIDSRLDV